MTKKVFYISNVKANFLSLELVKKKFFLKKSRIEIKNTIGIYRNYSKIVETKVSKMANIII